MNVATTRESKEVNMPVVYCKSNADINENCYTPLISICDFSSDIAAFKTATPRNLQKNGNYMMQKKSDECVDKFKEGWTTVDVRSGCPSAISFVEYADLSTYRRTIIDKSSEIGVRYGKKGGKMDQSSTRNI